MATPTGGAGCDCATCARGIHDRTLVVTLADADERESSVCVRIDRIDRCRWLGLLPSRSTIVEKLRAGAPCRVVLLQVVRELGAHLSVTGDVDVRLLDVSTGSDAVLASVLIRSFAP